MMKSLPTSKKEALRFLIEDFLERDIEDIIKKNSKIDHGLRQTCERLFQLLSTEPIWLEHIQDRIYLDSAYEKVIRDLHMLMKPIWKKIKEAIFDYILNVIPEKEEEKKVNESYPSDMTPIEYQFRSMLLPFEDQRSYSIKLPQTRLSILMSLERGVLDITKKDLHVVYIFIDFISGIPIDLFGKCEHCSKCIIKLRGRKKYCPGCAAKKYQQDLWASDPKGCKEYQKNRYKSRKDQIPL